MSRNWITPLTIGTFALMAITGILMFFHLDTGLNKLAHEWLGWLMVGGVALHAAVNGKAFKRYLVQRGISRFVLALSLLTIAASFLSLPGDSGGHRPPPVIALNAITRAPIDKVAQLAGKPVDQVMAELGRAGIRLSKPTESLEEILGANRKQQGLALTLIFGSPSP